MQTYHLRVMRPMPGTSKNFRIMVACHDFEAKSDDAAVSEAHKVEFEDVREDDVLFLTTDDMQRIWTI